MKKGKLVAVLLMTTLMGVNTFGSAIRLNINGKDVTSKVAPRIIDDRTMVPIREIFENIGAKVIWLEADKTVVAEKGKTKVTMSVGDDFYTVDGKVVSMGTPSIVYQGKVLAPARYAAKAFGLDVSWDSENKIVYIVDKNVPIAETTTEVTTEATTEAITEYTAISEGIYSVAETENIDYNSIGYVQKEFYTVLEESISNYYLGTYSETEKALHNKITELKEKTTNADTLAMLNKDDKIVSKVGSMLQQFDLYYRLSKDSNFEKIGIKDSIPRAYPSCKLSELTDLLAEQSSYNYDDVDELNAKVSDSFTRTIPPSIVNTMLLYQKSLNTVIKYLPYCKATENVENVYLAVEYTYDKFMNAQEITSDKTHKERQQQTIDDKLQNVLGVLSGMNKEK